jgi:hypothetical protein
MRDVAYHQEIHGVECNPRSVCDQIRKTRGRMRHKADTPVHQKDWYRAVRRFEGDPIMKEIVEEGQRIREAERWYVGV